MVRFQAQLTPEQVRALKRLAAEREVSVALLVREGVELLLDAQIESGDEERWKRAQAAVGRFCADDGADDAAERHDRELVQIYAG